MRAMLETEYCRSALPPEIGGRGRDFISSIIIATTIVFRPRSASSFSVGRPEPVATECERTVCVCVFVLRTVEEEVLHEAAEVAGELRGDGVGADGAHDEARLGEQRVGVVGEALLWRGLSGAVRRHIAAQSKFVCERRRQTQP